MKAATLPEQLASKVSPAVIGDCWLWVGSLNPKGYGRVRFGEPRGDGRGAPARQAHRVVYELLVGPIPDGLVLDHLCRNRSCVNPDHLEPVTQQENSLRGTTLPAENARKTHCVNGHEFTAENTRVTTHGHRECRLCRATSKRKGRQ